MDEAAMTIVFAKKLSADWKGLPGILQYFAAVWILGAVTLTSLSALYPAARISYPAQLPESVPISLPSPSESNSGDGLIAYFGGAEVVPIGKGKPIAVSEWLNKVIVNSSNAKVATIENFVLATDGKVSKVIVKVQSESGRPQLFSTPFATFSALRTDYKVVLDDKAMIWTREPSKN